MKATLTLRINNLPDLEGELVQNIFTYNFSKDSPISPDELKKMQKSSSPIRVVLTSQEEDYLEASAYITVLKDQFVQFLLFEDS